MDFELKDIGKIGIALVVGAIVLGLGAGILTTLQSSQTNNVAATYGLLTWGGNNTAMGLGINDIVASSVVLKNNATTCNLGSNYTVNAADGTITITNKSGTEYCGRSEWVTSNLNVSFNYYIGSAARNATGFGVRGVNTFASYIPTIAIVAAAAVVIGIMLVYFRRRN